ncbi:hypothetical protein PCC6311_2240 [Synechococcus elongatus PCC 6311]|uniref:Uncharacterized protein n=2 Tax=Synechococcus elongatus TaxID=32046 RepID=Q31L82_SYNE7|nr:conserved hypothetical protein [Synechococcus elongatus PCC 7942 = FACHB-805]AJD57337.1 hypothetical protein M744_05570 [Synechococcus elongatus UTEX 2973]UOW71984.1 hypothetical protein PCC7943_2242 [Synechococcus elongatus PCC 7943]UOW74703.1 hypothetical protein PCC6311_2240 [Synechococcus elongatus PCC 6311]UOW77424.1 hypothetical protein PCC6301pg_2242 [Synechococcus elongatus PCC 6301]
MSLESSQGISEKDYHAALSCLRSSTAEPARLQDFVTKLHKMAHSGLSVPIASIFMYQLLQKCRFGLPRMKAVSNACLQFLVVIQLRSQQRCFHS